jgi:hypothetical protein
MCWKPLSILPAPKWAVKRAIKLCYAEWPEPINWTTFSGFFMEFADLALHLSQEDYVLVEKLRKSRFRRFGEECSHDPLLMYRLQSGTAALFPIENSAQLIIQIRDGLRRSTAWEPFDVDSDELEVIRRVLLESTTEYATLIQEWRLYIVSIGRDTYIGNM